MLVALKTAPDKPFQFNNSIWERMSESYKAKYILIELTEKEEIKEDSNIQIKIKKSKKQQST